MLERMPRGNDERQLHVLAVMREKGILMDLKSGQLKKACREIYALAREGQIEVDEAVILYFKNKHNRETLVKQVWNGFCEITGW